MTEKNNIPSQPRDIMHYESDIWAIADLLLAASVKQSDFPAYMMPFFALMMLEGRMLNAMKLVEEEEGLTVKDHPEDFKEAFIDRDCGYNEYIVMQGKTLQNICNNDKTFEQDFASYLSEFDPTLKKLLGIERGKDEKKFLNMDYYVAELRSKKILLSVITAWSKIDLSPYDNSAITTLEEHIKRKWADISASTAGEQYTPDDIISLIADIVATKVTKPKSQNIHVYDPTCGGANLLFGVADRLHTQAGYRNIHTWGSEYNDDISDTQKSIVNLMKKQGVDVIIGTHPHTVQAIEYDELAGTLVAYSLGDFFGDASRGGTNYSIILDLEITKDSSTGTTKVTNYSYTPIYTVSEAESADGYRRVVRIDKTVEAWEENYLDKVSQSAKESMVYALDRIEARINPPVVEKKK